MFVLIINVPEKTGWHTFPWHGNMVNVFYQILNTFLSNKMFLFRARIHKNAVRIANREDPDQTASSEAV